MDKDQKWKEERDTLNRILCKWQKQGASYYLAVSVDPGTVAVRQGFSPATRKDIIETVEEAAEEGTWDI